MSISGIMIRMVMTNTNNILDNRRMASSCRGDGGRIGGAGARAMGER
jgi:hypothetical protein